MVNNTEYTQKLRLQEKIQCTLKPTVILLDTTTIKGLQRLNIVKQNAPPVEWLTVTLLLTLEEWWFYTVMEKK